VTGSARPYQDGHPVPHGEPVILGKRQLVFFAGASATFLTVVTGVAPTAFAMTGAVGIPLAFLLVGFILRVFTTGFVAMSRYIVNAGAFYAYIAQGLSKRLGVGAAWLALTSYNALQVGLYGLFGVTAGSFTQQYLHLEQPWWAYALMAWALTAGLGMMQIDVNGRVLGVLFVAEVAIIAVWSLANLLHPSPEGVSFAALEPSAFAVMGFALSVAIMALGFLGFIGFEGVSAFSEETRDTVASLKAGANWTIGLSVVVYVVSIWSMTVTVGPSQIVAQSREQGPELAFTLAADHFGPLGSLMVFALRFLLLTSVFAALLSFHNTVARYAFALGRERVLPQALARTSAATSAPWIASLCAQSSVGLIVITGCALTGVDPILQLFYYSGTAGGLGVLTLLVITSMAVATFFARNRRGESRWATRVSPTAAALLLGTILVAAVTHLDLLLGVPAGHPMTMAVPLVIVILLNGGWLWGTYLQTRRPEVFAHIGQGPASVRAEAVTS
jgi:amino acid transporter